MVWRGGVAWLAGIVLPWPAVAQSVRLVDFNVPAQGLAGSLSTIARQTGVELLFDARAVQGATASNVRGRISLDQALRQVLGPAGLTFHRTPDGAILIAVQPLSPQANPQAEIGAIPEILVIGNRPLNVDIPRSEDDIQPYRIVTALTIAQSGDQIADLFLKTRLSSNTQTLLSAQTPVFNNGDTRSQIDLRGLGTNQTLVLVDGHRLPAFPGLDAFLQPDINGIPLNAIQRIETLSSTAAGIYGPGALGGVVNVILDRDAYGASIGMTRGISSRGDAPAWRLDGHVGWTSPGGGTTLSIVYSHSADGGLTVGNRSFVERARTQRYNSDPGYSDMPSSTMIDIVLNDPFASSLSLTKAFGGKSLHATTTTLPVAALGTPQEVAWLLANAGTFDFALPPDGEGTGENLLTATINDGASLTLKQRLGDRLEIFIDALAFASRGSATGSLDHQDGDTWPVGGNQKLLGLSYGGPFAELVQYSFPALGPDGHYTTRDRMAQATIGLIAQLPAGWRADADLSIGFVDTRSHFPSRDAGDAPNLFDPASLAAYLQLLQAYPYTTETTSDRLIDGTARIAGPLLRLPGGPLTMTSQIELRSDRNPGINWKTSPASYRSSVPIDSPSQTQAVQSAYTELRAPLVPSDFSLPPLRGLEFQMSARADRYRMSVPTGYPTLLDVAQNVDVGTSSRLRKHYDMAAFTLGGRVRPLPGLILRTSYATGSVPPDPADLITHHSMGAAYVYDSYNDPKRNGELPNIAEVSILTDGRPNLRTEHARSLNVGIVLAPLVLPGARLSIDYTEIQKSREVSFVENNKSQFFLDHENEFPGRIIRAPLTPQDAARGDTGGKILAIDMTAFDDGRSVLRAIDADLSYDRATRIGDLHLYAQATWTPSYRRQQVPGGPYHQLVGYLDGPLAWKGNAGFTWSRSQFSAGANIQVFGDYKVQYGEQERNFLSDVMVENLLLAAAQANVPIDPAAGLPQSIDGNFRIKPQACLDLFLRYRIGGHPGLAMQLSVHNALDKLPPLFVPELDQQLRSNFGLGYSYLGDPRGRYFQLSVTTSF
jgi:outer membrane receptor protein involved in Fe transport